MQASICNCADMLLAWASPSCSGDVDWEALKVRFCREAVEGRDRFQRASVFDEDLEETLQWVAERAAEEVGNTLHVARDLAYELLCTGE